MRVGVLRPPGGAAAPYLHHMGVITRRTDDVRVSCCRVERLCRTGRRAGDCRVVLFLLANKVLEITVRMEEPRTE
jgi:hypothetical protein